MAARLERAFGINVNERKVALYCYCAWGSKEYGRLDWLKKNSLCCQFMEGLDGPQLKEALVVPGFAPAACGAIFNLPPMAVGGFPPAATGKLIERDAAPANVAAWLRVVKAHVHNHGVVAFEVANFSECHAF